MLLTQAIYQALVGRVRDDDRGTIVSIVMILGAGRGPLVRAVMAAADRAQRLVKVYAIEKNPNAVVTSVHLYCVCPDS